TSPQAKRRSWCRSSLKGTKGRKSLPPVHQDVAELSKSISLDLPEVDRLSVLLLSSFQVRSSLLKVNDFSLAFFLLLNVLSTSQRQRRLGAPLPGGYLGCVLLGLGHRGCSLAVPTRSLLRSFTEESRSWDELLQRYKESAEEMSRQLERRRLEGGRAEPTAFLQTSQARALGSKPDYRKVLDDQREVLSSMELVLDGLQQTATLLQTFSEDSRRYLERQSKEMAARTFQHLEQSPVRKLIAGPPRKTLPPKA
ncbi:DSN1 protein, partial [Steatornis caripensis]|nr:DSN1 protein [Steatornis caripensis]